MSAEDNTYQGRPLTDELGTERNIRMTGAIDIRKSTNLERRLVVPIAALSILADDDPAIEEFVDDVLNLLTSVDGRRVRELLRGELVRKGGSTDLSPEPSRPGFLARHNPLDAKARSEEEEYQAWKRDKAL